MRGSARSWGVCTPQKAKKIVLLQNDKQTKQAHASRISQRRRQFHLLYPGDPFK